MAVTVPVPPEGAEDLTRAADRDAEEGAGEKEAVRLERGAGVCRGRELMRGSPCVGGGNACGGFV